MSKAKVYIHGRSYKDITAKTFEATGKYVSVPDIKDADIKRSFPEMVHSVFPVIDPFHRIVIYLEVRLQD